MSAPCPYCGATANIVRNPFYGTGLAVHETIVDCGECRRVRLQGERREPVAQPAPASAGRHRLFAVLHPQWVSAHAR
jgi:hypothetical protein